jgi:hypothetical protein
MEQRSVSHRSTLLHRTRSYGCRKASPSRRCVFLVPREIHALSYRELQGREKGKADWVGCRTSEWGLVSGKLGEMKLGIALTTQIKRASMGGKSGLMMIHRHSRNKRCGDGRHRTWPWGSNVEWEIYVHVLRDPLGI